jgi:hypothetical protein
MLWVTVPVQQSNRVKINEKTLKYCKQVSRDRGYFFKNGKKGNVSAEMLPFFL